MPRTAGSKTKTYAPLDLADLQATSVIADPREVSSLAPKTRGVQAAERSPVQKQFDQWASEYHQWWTSAGKPEPFTDACPPRKVYVKDTAQAESAHIIARGAAAHAGFGIRFGTDNPTTDGRIVVSYCVVDKIPRKEKSNSNGQSAG